MASSAFNQNATAGFIELYTLQMRMAQRSERTVLLSIGGRKHKLALLKTARQLVDLKYKIYATYIGNIVERTRPIFPRMS